MKAFEAGLVEVDVGATSLNHNHVRTYEADLVIDGQAELLDESWFLLAPAGRSQSSRRVSAVQNTGFSPLCFVVAKTSSYDESDDIEIG